MAGVQIRALTEADVSTIARAFEDAGWPGKNVDLYQRYVNEQGAGLRPVFLAIVDGEFAGYATVAWRSSYAPFLNAGIPEIQDLNVLPRFRRMHIATALLDAAEALIKTRSPIAGIGVGLYADYGAAQSMYVRRGYVPDGRGLAYRFVTVEPLTTVTLDDDLNIMLTKSLVAAESK
jgi:GNAT superfamily N-acetyltransferase